MCRYEDVQMIYNYIICTSLYLHICVYQQAAPAWFSK